MEKYGENQNSLIIMETMSGGPAKYRDIILKKIDLKLFGLPMENLSKSQE